VIDLWRALRDPRVSTAIALAAVVVLGFALVAQAYRGVAATLFVPFQVPLLVSGGLAGIALLGAGIALLNVHLDRTEAAQERQQLADLQRAALRLLALARSPAPAPAGERRRSPRPGSTVDLGV
jgi:hypothetical protein